MTILGIDPSNKRVGWAVIGETGLLEDYGSFCPWKAQEYPEPIDALTVYVEIPQHGTHSTRGGIHWSGGMAVSILGPFDYSQVKKVLPNTWRSKVFGSRFSPRINRETWKRWGPMKCKELFGIDPANDDEAEAVLLAYYGHLVKRKPKRRKR